MVVLEDNLVNQWCWYIRPKKTKDLKHKKPNVSKKNRIDVIIFVLLFVKNIIHDLSLLLRTSSNPADCN